MKEGKKVTVKAVISELSVEYKLNFANRYAYTAVSGDFDLSASMSLTGGATSGSVLLGTVLTPVGPVNLALEYSLDGKLTLKCSNKILVGLEYSSGGGFRIVKSFEKKSFTLSAEMKMFLGVRISLGADIPGFEANIYAETGMTLKQTLKFHTDGETPIVCDHRLGYLSVSIGAEASIGCGTLKISYNKSIDLINEYNSPVRLVSHFEDGEFVPECTRGKKVYYGNGYNSGNSKYGSIVW